jgi:hypothetical protein
MLKICDLSYLNLVRAESRVHISGFIQVIELPDDPHRKKLVIGSSYTLCRQIHRILTILEILYVRRKFSHAVRSAKLIEDDAKVWRCMHAAVKLNSMSDGITRQPEPEVNVRRSIKKAPSEEGALGAFHVRDLSG